MANGMRVGVGTMILGVLLTGCAGGPVAGTSPSATPDVSTSSASDQETPALIPFGGDCARAASASDVGRILGGTVAVSPSSHDLTAVEPDRAASQALIGGLVCTWTGAGGTAMVELFPEDVVPADIADRLTSFTCLGSGYCSRAEGAQGTSINASVAQRSIAADPTEAERRELEQKVTALLAVVRSADPADLRSRAASREPGRWMIPPCSAFDATVAHAAGQTALTVGFPGDAIPSGTAWEIAVARGVEQWCSWYAYGEANALTLIELSVQPGLGTPTPDQLASAGAAPASVGGASAAFAIPSGAEGNARIVAVSRENRLSVTGVLGSAATSLADVATAVLAQLDAR